MARKDSSTKLLNDIITVINQYKIKMTVRQVYYRLVAAQKVPNSDKSYQRVKAMLGDARKEGIIPFDAIEDRTRDILFMRDGKWLVRDGIQLVRWSEEDIPVERFEKAFLDNFKVLDTYYDLPRWYGQDSRVIVMVEKQALQGLFQNVCFEKQVDLLVCKGYPSLSILNELAKRLRKSGATDIRIKYHGDYDPSGLDIDRDVQNKMRNQFGIKFDFERIAITREQIDEYNIPPAPAKTSDSRFQSMEDNEGEAMQVELDAIDPPDLQGIIADAIDVEFDEDIYEEERAEELGERRELIKAWIQEVMK